MFRVPKATTPKIWTTPSCHWRREDEGVTALSCGLVRQIMWTIRCPTIIQGSRSFCRIRISARPKRRPGSPTYLTAIRPVSHSFLFFRCKQGVSPLFCWASNLAILFASHGVLIMRSSRLKNLTQRGKQSNLHSAPLQQCKLRLMHTRSHPLDGF